MSILNRISSAGYLFSTNEEFKYWYIYLPFFSLLAFLAFAVNIALKRRDDYRVKKSLERQFFWAYLIFGFLGLASVFARAQNLPVFGNRVMTFIVLGLFIAVNIWLVIYFFKVTKKQQLKFAQKKRKEKWLRKK